MIGNYEYLRPWNLLGQIIGKLCGSEIFPSQKKGGNIQNLNVFKPEETSKHFSHFHHPVSIIPFPSSFMPQGLHPIIDCQVMLNTPNKGAEACRKRRK